MMKPCLIYERTHPQCRRIFLCVKLKHILCTWKNYTLYAKRGGEREEEGKGEGGERDGMRVQTEEAQNDLGPFFP